MAAIGAWHGKLRVKHSTMGYCGLDTAHLARNSGDVSMRCSARNYRPFPRREIRREEAK